MSIAERTGLRPLVVSRDESLLEDVLRIAAATGAEVEVVPDAVAARARWPVAPSVLVGSDLAGQCARAAFARRGGVVVLDRNEPTGEIWRHAVALGAEQVLTIPVAESALVEILRGGGDPSTRTGPVLACVGGRGGAGASILAAALAVTAARGTPTLLLDLDPYGGGLDMALGGEGSGGLRWCDLGSTTGRLSAPSLREALPRLGGVAVLATSRTEPDEIDAGTAAAVIRSAAAAGDTVVLDLPRRLSPAAREGLVLADRVLFVVPAEVRACVAAAAFRPVLAALTDRLELVVRTASRSRVPAAVVASTVGLPLTAVVRSQEALAAAADRGEMATRVRGPLGSVCRDLLDSRGVQREAAA